ncbi:E3 ubiquitin-protein ligase TRIM15-like [Caretta caretta]|uniref:E3 ubiquitin-protein ligase TRIM15-like n=1 Tax=Caretta caretta TaxID=8467 RepID=UPI003F4B74AD
MSVIAALPVIVFPASLYLKDPRPQRTQSQQTSKEAEGRRLQEGRRPAPAGDRHIAGQVNVTEKIQSRLESLKKERDEILSDKSSGENTSQELLEQLETERQKIVSEFQRLRQFLDEQERLLLAQLEELNKEIEKRRDEYVGKLSEEISSFSSLISEMEQKCQLPASEFLQVRRC